MVEQIQEQTDDSNLLIVIKHLSRTAFQASAVESIVEIEKYKTVATVVATAISLHIVVRPVIVSKEELGSHIVGELIDVEQCLYLVIDARVVDTFGKVTELFEDLVSTILKRVVFKHVDLLIVVAEVGIDELVVVRLAHVDHTTELAVDVFHHLDCTLHIEVNA